jgi:uncharacterized lipoprotein YehR (DUF1307 family)
MKLKGILTFLLTLFLVLSLAACGGSSGVSAGGDSGYGTSPETVPDEATEDSDASDSDLSTETSSSTSSTSDSEEAEEESALESSIETQDSILSSDDESEEESDGSSSSDDSSSASSSSSSDDSSSASSSSSSDDSSSASSSSSSDEETDMVALASSNESFLDAVNALVDSESGSSSSTSSTTAATLDLEGIDFTADVSDGKWRTAPSVALTGLTEEQEALQAEITSIKSSISAATEEMVTIANEVLEIKDEADTVLAAYEAAVEAGETATAETLAAEYETLIESFNTLKDEYVALQESRVTLLEELTAARTELGFGTEQQGIYSPWANQEIALELDNIETAGWYNLTVFAKNIYGALPEDYGSFNLSVYNATTGKSVGGLQVPASVTTYQADSLYVYLEEGSNELVLTWTNDAYKAGEYDANINIGSITLSYADQSSVPYVKGYRTADQYSEVDGTFYWSADSVRTYWSGQTIGFDFTDLEAGTYQLTVEAMNYGSAGLPDDYDAFIVEVETSTGESATLEIKASETDYQKRKISLDLAGGDTTVYLTWTNDRCVAGEYDTNIQYRQIQLKKTGNSQKKDSSLTNYLLGTDSGNKMLLLIGFAAAAMAALAISFVHRRKSSNN